MAEMSQRAFARHLGVTLRAVQKAIASGRIRLNDNRKIDSESAAADWVRNTDEGRVSFSDLSRRRAPVSASPDEDEEELDEEGMDANGPPAAGGAAVATAGAKEDPAVRQYRVERAARESIRRQREQAELDEYRGALIDVAEAQRLAFTAFRTLRDAVLNVPVRVKDLLAAETDPTRIEAMLEKELASALQQVDQAAILREQEEDEDDGGD
ncbi:hypothetical protein [Cupriavidus malaysiensis]|uniref:Terminase small subunit n=1 Tax=Cupriavidus malaysiensis TaxID=367825 RepID=A0ABN4TLE5_9BURK|nr:hypothetical protein [Cupriavidus malaysiensis]AOZ05955.1 hypothetical protein BKK80_09035 [Cupriavidus malaysiensis]